MKLESDKLEKFWEDRYREARTGWDIGYASTPLVAYIDQLANKEVKILIPGAGNAYEAEYLFRRGFTSVHVLDIAAYPLNSLQTRLPDFPSKQLIQENFFTHKGQYDLILEQTFFCSFDPAPENRAAYAHKMASLLKPNGKLVGLWFKHPLDRLSGRRPFGGSREEYVGYLQPYFDIVVFEDARNSIPPRMGNELFGIFKRKARGA
ncbi:MAG: methyltransferase domain-containing protein [Bacteroidota bacterium]